MKIWLLLFTSVLFAADKNILLIAGKPSHGPGQHEHNAGVLLLTKWLNTVPGIRATTSLNGVWPTAADFDQANAILVFSDGGERHPAFEDGHPPSLSKAAARGAGLMFMHYAVEPPAQRGHEEMLEWAGGFFEVNYSINPFWVPKYANFPKHPITRGVKPFQIRDEWYYNMRFPTDLAKAGVTGILIDTPPAETVQADGLRSGNPDVRAKIGRPQIMMWAFARKNKGRSVGFTGGHQHTNLGQDDYRKLLLNALLWVAKVEVPKNGVSVAVSPAELAENLDPKAPVQKR